MALAVAVINIFAPSNDLSAQDTYKFYEYPGPLTANEKAALDECALRMKQDPSWQACILFYSARKNITGQSKKAADNAKNYLVTRHGIDPTRILTLDGGYKEKQTIELWFMPDGAAPPKANPTVKSAKLQTSRPKAK